MTTIAFKTTNSSTAFWAGFARQTIDFQNALGELIDNSLSATKPKRVGQGNELAVIELVIEELENGNLKIIVADAGAGVTLENLTGDNNIFNIGFNRATPGTMNEHGFGLKNALALMTSGFSLDFRFITRPYKEPGKLYYVDGPISENMSANEGDISLWEEGLEDLKAADSGVKIVIDVKRNYFNSLYNRATSFETLIVRLAEHLGVMYSSFIEASNEIYIRYKSKDADNWTKLPLPAIPTPFLVNAESAKKEVDIEIEVDGKKYTAKYITGILDTSIKDASVRSDLPYPLKSHFQGSNARCGLTLSVRGRVLKTGVFNEIWPEKAGDVSFNNFLGELRLGSDFRTTNNKTDVDPHSIVWTRLKEKLKEEFEPESTTKKQTEESLRKKIMEQIRAVVTGSKPTKKVVWDGGGEIDIYYEADSKITCMELKIEPARVRDVYQLVMYWDGLVHEGIAPHDGILVSSANSVIVNKAIDHINSLKDKAGNNYKLRTMLIEQWARP